MDWPRLLATDAANAPSRRELLAKALERLRIVFQLRIGAIIPLQDITDSIDDAIHFGIRETHVREYMTVWRARDPILHSALDARAPAYAHGPKAGSAAKLTVLCSDFGRRVGAGSYMVMPIYGSFGEIAATIHICRDMLQRDFDTYDFERAVAFSGFLSTMLSGLRERGPAMPARLAPRELQVARLAVHGLSNPQIASELGLSRETVKRTLSRVYAKTQSANRAQLSALGARCGWLDRV